jgi:hypothetical protein
LALKGRAVNANSHSENQTPQFVNDEKGCLIRETAGVCLKYRKLEKRKILLYWQFRILFCKLMFSDIYCRMIIETTI